MTEFFLAHIIGDSDRIHPDTRRLGPNCVRDGVGWGDVGAAVRDDYPDVLHLWSVTTSRSELLVSHEGQGLSSVRGSSFISEEIQRMQVQRIKLGVNI